MRGGKRRVLGAIERILGALFLVSAALQLNDPDPLGWVAIYTLGGVACLWPSGSRAKLLLAGSAAAAAWVWAAVLAPRTLGGGIVLSDLVKRMDTKTPQVELGRELLGLVMLAATLSVVALGARRGAEPDPAAEDG